MYSVKIEHALDGVCETSIFLSKSSSMSKMKNVKSSECCVDKMCIDVNIDTSDSLQALIEEYKKTQAPVEVDFRKMVSWIKLGDQLTHQIHPYPAKLLPHIANYFVRARSLTKNSPIILDPFCGTGTIALESSIAGYQPYIADANPLAILIAKVKTYPYDIKELIESVKCVISRAKKYHKSPEIPVVNSKLWYEPEIKICLERIALSIEFEESIEIRDFLKVCLSVTARKLSFADPAISVPVRLKTKERFSEHRNNAILERLSSLKTVNPLEDFLNVCNANMRRIDKANSENPERKMVRLVGNDARNLRNVSGRKISAGSIPFVITSPPYGSAQKYIRASSLSLNWLGLATPSELINLEAKSIGRECVSKCFLSPSSKPLPKQFKNLIEKISLINPNRAKITEAYLNDMYEFMLEMHRVIMEKGHIVLVLGNNEVCGEPLRNDLYVIDIMQTLGFDLKLNLIDHIKSRGLMTRRNKTSSMITRESILIFQKNSNGSDNGRDNNQGKNSEFN